MSAAEKPDLLDAPVNALHISFRLYNCLTRHNQMKTVRDVVAWSAREMMRTPGLGRLSLNELICALDSHGLQLAPDPYAEPQVPAPPTVHQRLEKIEARLTALERR